MPMSPSIAYFAGLHRPGLIPQPMAPQMPQQVPQQQMPPQMGQQIPPQMMQQPMQPGQQMPGQPPVGMMQPGMMQMNPQLLAQLAQLHGMGLGGMRQQMPMFGRPSIQPITSGAYSLR